MKISFKPLLLACLLISVIPVSCQKTPGNKQQKSREFTTLFYNVENLYDIVNDPVTNDDDFTPQGKIPWTQDRYEKKLENLSKVISSALSPGMPDLIGLAEIENKKVLEDLISQPSLSKTPYGIVHFDSPDERGIDVALLYNKKTFTVTHSEPLPVTLRDDKTRDILYVSGKLNNGSVLHIFVNHWPSRREGAEVSEPKRMEAARVLKEHVDKLFSGNSKANILILGDFNDNPDDRSIMAGLGARKPDGPAKPGSLYDLMIPIFNTGEGSLYSRGWDLFDQIIVSGNLLVSQPGADCSPEDAGIFRAEWMLFTDNNGQKRPNRTIGNRYFGGYSDHLPVYVKMK